MNASAPRASDWHISPACVNFSSRSLFERSATRPANGESTRMGPNWHAATKPTATPLLVRWSTNRVRATSVSQLPVLEISWPMKNSRKLRVRRARTRPRTALRKRVLTAPFWRSWASYRATHDRQNGLPPQDPDAIHVTDELLLDVEV